MSLDLSDGKHESDTPGVPGLVPKVDAQAGPYGYVVDLHLAIAVKARTSPRSDVYVDVALDEVLAEWMQLELAGRN